MTDTKKDGGAVLKEQDCVQCPNCREWVYLPERCTAPAPAEEVRPLEDLLEVDPSTLNVVEIAVLRDEIRFLRTRPDRLSAQREAQDAERYRLMRHHLLIVDLDGRTPTDADKERFDAEVDRAARAAPAASAAPKDEQENYK